MFAIDEQLSDGVIRKYHLSRLQRDERGALACGVHRRIPGYFPTVCNNTPTAEKCDVDHVSFHSVRLLRDPSLATLLKHSNWQRGFWQCFNVIGFTHPTKQTNKQTPHSYNLLHPRNSQKMWSN
jgi:hypothetical protein